MRHMLDEVIPKNLEIVDNFLCDIDISINSGKYGLIDGEKLTLFDSKSTFVKISDIERIKKGVPNEILIYKKDGKIIKSYRKINKHEFLTEEKPLFDKTLSSHVHYMPLILPDLLDSIFYDSLNDVCLIDTCVLSSDDNPTEHNLVPLSDDIVRSLIIKTENESQRIFNQKFRTSKETMFDYLKAMGFYKEKDGYNPFLFEIINKSFEDHYFNCEDFLLDAGATLPDGFTDNEIEIYLKAVSKALFLAIIERQLKNNVTVDFVPVFIGKGETGKTSICKKLGFAYIYDDGNNPRSSFYRETSTKKIDKKAFHESIKGAVVVEMREGIIFKGDCDVLKDLVDSNTFQYRPSYDREPKIFTARHLMIATSNNYELFSDLTGNRRYFPVYFEDSLKSVQEITHDQILQYYADAYLRVLSGESFRSSLNEVKDIAERLRAYSIDLPDGLTELNEILYNLCPEIGDKIPTQLITRIIKELHLEFDNLDTQLRFCGFDKKSSPFRLKKDTACYDRSLTYGIPVNTQVVRGYSRVKPKPDI